MKAEVEKLEINNIFNVATSFKNLKTNVDDVDVGKLENLPVDLKKLTDIVDSEVVKNIKFNTLNTKVNNLEKKTPDVTTLIHVKQ